MAKYTNKKNVLMMFNRFFGMCEKEEQKNLVLDMKQAYLELPTANVAEVKLGEWVPYELAEGDDRYGYGDNEEKGTIWYKCSVCETDALGRCYDDEWYSYPIRTDYCPKCGADLRTPK